MATEWHFNMMISHDQNKDITEKMADHIIGKIADAIMEENCNMGGSFHPLEPGVKCESCQESIEEGNWEES